MALSQLDFGSVTSGTVRDVCVVSTHLSQHDVTKAQELFRDDNEICLDEMGRVRGNSEK